jgi:uncharacterized protein YyaL (SSP411 family)
MQRVADLFDDENARKLSTYVLETIAPAMARYPTAFGHMLGNADMAINGAVEVAIAGENGRAELLRTLAEEYVPSLVLAGGDPDGVALLNDRHAVDGKATAFVCRNYSCKLPATTVNQLAEQLIEVRGQTA